MANVTYEQAYKDRQYLWQTHGAAHDMTGGYVDSEDLEKLLKSPTKSTARKCLINQIQHWFRVGPDLAFAKASREEREADPRVLEIAERYGCDAAESLY